MTGKRVRIQLADDHSIVRAGVRRVLETVPRFEVVGESERGDQTVEMLQELQPDVLILDLNMPGGDGFDVLHRARDVAPEVRIVVLTMHTQAEYVTRAIREGADGYLLKDLAVQDLITAVDSVVSGRPFFSGSAQQAMLGSLRGGASPLDALSPREKEVLVGIAKGLTSKEIAAQFDISVRTVESHRASLMRKLDVRSVALLTQLAVREGLVGER
jgi:DNA-binding NarL/FixJ family response regulator